MIFNLTGEVTISVYTKVEAETLEQAIEIAQERSVERAVWRSKKQSEEVWVSDEYDGEVNNITNAD